MVLSHQGLSCNCTYHASCHRSFLFPLYLPTVSKLARSHAPVHQLDDLSKRKKWKLTISFKVEIVPTQLKKKAINCKMAHPD